MSIISNIFKREKKLYFALVVADQPLEDAKFEAGSDCKVFITTGECVPHHVIPTSVMRSIIDRFEIPPDGNVKITEKIV